ncbi:MAG: hemerythrin domain-containing protein [Labilithrix sp.]
MTTRLRETVVAQHRRLLVAIDRAETSLDEPALTRLRSSVVKHLETERKLLFPLATRAGDGARYGEEEHLVLHFVLDRLLTATSQRDRSTRLRVLRDLFVHHMERTEWVTLQLFERPSGVVKKPQRRKRG